MVDAGSVDDTDCGQLPDCNPGNEMLRLRTVLFLIVAAPAASGCMLPEYYHPGGYSSTSLKRLDESHVEWPKKSWSFPAMATPLTADAQNSSGDSVWTTPDSQGEPSPVDHRRIANHRGRFARQ